jgi:hypothetical protein
MAADLAAARYVITASSPDAPDFKQNGSIWLAAIELL